MAAAIYLDDEPSRMTAKINKIAADCDLSAKMSTFELSLAQIPPELSLSGPHHEAQLPGKWHACISLA